jgi:hypothetical protein
VASNTTIVPAAWAARSPARSATAPSADCTTLTATTSASTARSTSSASGTSSTTTPRPACAAKGNVTLVKSPARTTTLAPAGRPAATCATSCDTALPIAIRDRGTPTSSANAARAVAIAGS